jgi:SAM-dependent methyltransferase
MGPEYFDENYFRYTVLNGIPYERRTAGRQFMNWAMSIFTNYNPDSHLDVGCAYGYLNEAMRLGGCWSLGVDWSKHCIDKAKTEGNKGFIMESDVRDGLEQFETNQFNVVTAFNLVDRIEIEDLGKAVKSIARVSQQPILLELIVAKDDRNPDWTGITGDLSLVSVYSLGFWQKVFKEAGCVMFEGNFDKRQQKAALLFMKQETPREHLETMTDNRLRHIFLRLGLQEKMEITQKEDFDSLTRDEIIEAIVAENARLIEKKSKTPAEQMIKGEDIRRGQK